MPCKVNKNLVSQIFASSLEVPRLPPSALHGTAPAKLFCQDSALQNLTHIRSKGLKQRKETLEVTDLP